MTTDLNSTAMPEPPPHERGSAARLDIIWLLRSHPHGLGMDAIRRALPTRRDDVEDALFGLQHDRLVERAVSLKTDPVFRLPERILRHAA